MTSASTGKFTAARVSVILFSACMMGGFVWYSHLKAQPKSGKTEAVAQTTQATILPGSKRSNAAIVPEDIDRLVVNKDGFTIDLNLEPAGGQSAVSPTSEKGMILPSSKLGVFRNIASSPSTTPQATDGESAPKMTPPPTSRPMMLSGSKSFAGPVISGERIGNVLIVGQDGKTAPKTPAAGPGPSPANAKPLGTETPAPQWNRDAPIFTSSKSGRIFPPVPQAPQRPVQAQSAAPQPPPPAKKAKTKAAPQPKADMPAPASP